MTTDGSYPARKIATDYLMLQIRSISNDFIDRRTALYCTDELICGGTFNGEVRTSKCTFCFSTSSGAQTEVDRWNSEMFPLDLPCNMCSFAIRQSYSEHSFWIMEAHAYYVRPSVRLFVCLSVCLTFLSVMSVTKIWSTFLYDAKYFESITSRRHQSSWKFHETGWKWHGLQ